MCTMRAGEDIGGERLLLEVVPAKCLHRRLGFRPGVDIKKPALGRVFYDWTEAMSE